MKFTKILLLTIAILVFSLSGCTGNGGFKPVDDADTTHSNYIDKFMYGIINEEDYNTIKLFVDSVEFPNRPELSSLYYMHIKESVDGLEELNLKSVPVLLNEIAEMSEVNTTEEIQKRETLELVSMYKMRIVNYFDLQSKYGEEYINNPNIYDIYTLCKTVLEETEKSNASTEEKLKTYQDFGLFSVPFVKKEIEKGDLAFEKYFIFVGAHVSTKCFCELTQFVNTTDLIPTQEERNESLLDAAENFDYKVWLSENEEDLNNLFAYLDAYCAEYEAKNKN